MSNIYHFTGILSQDFFLGRCFIKCLWPASKQGTRGNLVFTFNFAVLVLTSVPNFTHYLCIKVVASLLYAHTQSPVEKTNEEEALLLASYDGIEFASCHRPSKLSKGHASFKLKITRSQASKLKVDVSLIQSETNTSLF